MSDLSYLDGGLFSGEQMRQNLAEPVRALAQSWLVAGVDPAAVEIASEHLARWATALGEAKVSQQQVRKGLGYLELPEPVLELLATLLAEAQDPRGLAAIAVHLLDLAESMALHLFVPELPALFARADRTGDAARNVGLARHLKG